MAAVLPPVLIFTLGVVLYLAGAPWGVIALICATVPRAGSLHSAEGAPRRTRAARRARLTVRAVDARRSGHRLLRRRAADHGIGLARRRRHACLLRRLHADVHGDHPAQAAGARLPRAARQRRRRPQYRGGQDVSLFPFDRHPGRGRGDLHRRHHRPAARPRHRRLHGALPGMFLLGASASGLLRQYLRFEPEGLVFGLRRFEYACPGTASPASVPWRSRTTRWCSWSSPTWRELP